MADRSADWLAQAERDLRHARHARDAGDFEWAAFASHQAAEMALKAVFQHLQLETWGRVLSGLLGELPETTNVDDATLGRAARLDKHFILARYPDSYESGIPADRYSAEDAEAAIDDAEAFVAFCRSQIEA